MRIITQVPSLTFAVSLLLVAVPSAAQLRPPRTVTPPAPRSTTPLTVARIRATVFDSITMRPISAATIRMVRVENPAIGRTATSDLLGRFVFDSVDNGSWIATFLHPLLDSLRVEPGILRVDITEPGEIALPLATASPRTMMASTCRAALPADVGLVVGEIRRASGRQPVRRGGRLDAARHRWCHAATAEAERAVGTAFGTTHARRDATCAATAPVPPPTR